jgi:hypothetical protein
LFMILFMTILGESLLITSAMLYFHPLLLSVCQCVCCLSVSTIKLSNVLIYLVPST